MQLAPTVRRKSSLFGQLIRSANRTPAVLRQAIMFFIEQDLVRVTYWLSIQKIDHPLRPLFDAIMENEPNLKDTLDVITFNDDHEIICAMDELLKYCLSTDNEKEK